MCQESMCQALFDQYMGGWVDSDQQTWPCVRVQQNEHIA